MPDDRRQDEDGGFRKIFAIIAAVHLVVLGLILLLSFQPLKPQTETLVWMATGSFEDVAAGHDQNAASSGGLAPAESSDRTVEETDQTMEEQTPSPPPATPPPPSPAQLSTPQPTLPPVDDKPDLPLATPTPSPSATPTPKPTPHVMPKPTPAATPTPRPSVKPTPKPTARPTPKPTAKPSPKPSALSKPKSETSASPEEDTGDKKHAKPQGSPSPKFETGGSSKGKAPPTEVLNGSGNPRTGASKGASQGSAASDSTLAYYAEVIKNRFQAAWNQPHGEIAPGTELVATVKLKIQPDGTVTEFTLVDGSGNPVVDDSVREAGRKITKLPPPPDGTTFSPVVRFELGD